MKPRVFTDEEWIAQIKDYKQRHPDYLWEECVVGASLEGLMLCWLAGCKGYLDMEAFDALETVTQVDYLKQVFGTAEGLRAKMEDIKTDPNRCFIRVCMLSGEPPEEWFWWVRQATKKALLGDG